MEKRLNVVRGPETLGCRAVIKDLYISGESAKSQKLSRLISKTLVRFAREKAVNLVLQLIGRVEPGSDISLVAGEGKHALKAELMWAQSFERARQHLGAETVSKTDCHFTLSAGCEGRGPVNKDYRFFWDPC